MTRPTRRPSLLRWSLLAVFGGLLTLVWRVVWQLLSPLASIGLRELGYGVWLWPPLLAACWLRWPGMAMLVGLMSVGIEWAVLGSAPWPARLVAALVVEGLVLRPRPSLAPAMLVAALAAWATLPFDPPLGVAPLGWTDITAGMARGLGGAIVGGGGMWFIYRLFQLEKE